MQFDLVLGDQDEQASVSRTSVGVLSIEGPPGRGGRSK